MAGGVAIAIKYVIDYEKSKKNNTHLFESIPGLFPLIGLSGTLIALTIGLYSFASTNIQASITDILSGLKYAFIISLLAIVCSIGFQIWTSIIKSKKEKNTNNTDDESIFIQQAVSNSLVKVESYLHELVTSQHENTKVLKNVLEQIEKNYESLDVRLSRFSEVLQESNTSALVSVMEESTKKFNEQMSTLIDRLVKENFNELNNSVNNLNQWQNENKTALENIIEQLKLVYSHNQNSSLALADIAKYTKEILGESGRMNELNQHIAAVLAEDGVFNQGVKNMLNISNALDSQLTSLTALSEGEKELMKLAKQLVASVSEFKNLNTGVWEAYRKEMYEGVQSIREASGTASREINEKYKEYNEQFIQKLRSTFENLDKIMRSIAEHYLQQKNERR